MAHWFFSSDKHHLPWHFKNAALHVLFEQGLVGLALLGTAYVLVLVRLSVGRGRDHPLAPAFVAALIGFAVVGAFDSLDRRPRIGFLFFPAGAAGPGPARDARRGLPRASVVATLNKSLAARILDFGRSALLQNARDTAGYRCALRLAAIPNQARASAGTYSASP